MNTEKSSGKLSSPSRRRRIPRARIRQYAYLVAVVLIFAVTTCTVVAFVFHKTDSIKNTFTPPKYGDEITEDFDCTVKEDVTIKNTGDIPCYIRAHILFTWVKTDDSGKVTEVGPALPQMGTDYSLTLGSQTNWAKGPDGLYYYTKPVPADESTSILISECYQLKENPDGYKLSVEILSSSIQSVPTDAVVEAWSSGVSEVAANGDLVIKTSGGGTQ